MTPDFKICFLHHLCGAKVEKTIVFFTVQCSTKFLKTYFLYLVNN